nr:immunoglobulin heavy chain junction region [Mus musculus]MBK4189239.1 immunoglobulin heavy chain junction region [Mus musculus]MBK4189242.1 immunoglobulin heavy chain junction region [Mus musculus]NSM06957.1 immunoglobulin heavy chain junction region [Mus musculus]
CARTGTGAMDYW